MNIVIDGNIGSGKSTVLSLLKSKNNFCVINEDLESWKPYLEQFYQDMDKNSLSFQMKVLLHHLQNFQSITQNKGINILERSPLSCIHVFGESLRKEGKISDLDLELMKDYNKTFGWYPNILIYIKTDPEVSYGRIKERARDGEVVPLGYLQHIHEIYNKLYLDKEELKTLNIDTKIIIVDGNQNKEKVYERVKEVIEGIFS